jgi:diguanylate cyclase (GGDEF)-like protein
MLTMLATIVVVVFLSLVTGLGLGGFTRPLTLLDSAVLMMLLIMISAIPVMLCVSNHEKRSTAIALYRRATRDPLTGLLNRSTFEERARERLANGDGDLALLYLDLDHFKLVNDATSHVAGDDLIRAVADLVAAEFDHAVLVARTGGDEFAALLPASRGAATAAARRLLAAIDALRVPWQAQVLTTTASIGLAYGRAPHVDFDSLLSHADAACFTAKELGGNRMLAAAPDSDEIQVRTATMRSALQVREALDERRFALYCQPIVDLNTPTPLQRHFEILLRWTDGSGAVRAPAELIAAAERYRLGPRLDRYVVDATLNWLEQRPDACAWRSPRPAWSETAHARNASSRGCASWAAVSRSTISAPGSARSATCRTWTWITSRSTAVSSATWSSRHWPKRWCARSPTSPTSSTSAPSPSRRRPKRSWPCCGGWAWTTRRVTCSGTRSRSRRSSPRPRPDLRSAGSPARRRATPPR